jgi:hypothetical protein
MPKVPPMKRLARPQSNCFLAGILLLGILAGAVWLSLKGAAPHRKTIRDMRTNVG